MNQLGLFSGASFNSVIHDLSVSMDVEFESSGLSKNQVVDQMNDLGKRYGVKLTPGNGKQLKVDTLDKWLNEKEKQRYPSYVSLLIFCAVLDTTAPFAVMLKVVGGDVIGSKDVNLLKWAQEYHRAKEARTKMRKLEEKL